MADDQRVGYVALTGMRIESRREFIRYVQTPGGDFYEWQSPLFPGVLGRHRAEDLEQALRGARNHPHQEVALGVPCEDAA